MELGDCTSHKDKCKRDETLEEEVFKRLRTHCGRNEKPKKSGITESEMMNILQLNSSHEIIK